jgi:hypothetical protein
MYANRDQETCTTCGGIREDGKVPESREEDLSGASTDEDYWATLHRNMTSRSREQFEARLCYAARDKRDGNRQYARQSLQVASTDVEDQKCSADFPMVHRVSPVSLFSSSYTSIDATLEDRERLRRQCERQCTETDSSSSITIEIDENIACAQRRRERARRRLLRQQSAQRR